MKPLLIGDSAPDFDLPGTDGTNHTLNDVKGENGVVVIFSCNHCPYVIKKERKMIEMGSEFIAQGVGWVLICANDAVMYPADNFPNMKKRAAEKSYPFPYLHDEPQDTARAYNAEVTPHVFLFDDQLRLIYRGGIDDNPDNEPRGSMEYLRDALSAMLEGRGKELKHPLTQPRGCSVKWRR